VQYIILRRPQSGKTKCNLLEILFKFLPMLPISYNGKKMGASILKIVMPKSKRHYIFFFLIHKSNIHLVGYLPCALKKIEQVFLCKVTTKGWGILKIMGP